MDQTVEGKIYVNGDFQECCIGITDGKISNIKKILKGDICFPQYIKKLLKNPGCCPPDDVVFESIEVDGIWVSSVEAGFLSDDGIIRKGFERDFNEFGNFMGVYHKSIGIRSDRYKGGDLKIR